MFLGLVSAREWLNGCKEKSADREVKVETDKRWTTVNKTRINNWNDNSVPKTHKLPQDQYIWLKIDSVSGPSAKVWGIKVAHWTLSQLHRAETLTQHHAGCSGPARKPESAKCPRTRHECKFLNICMNKWWNYLVIIIYFYFFSKVSLLICSLFCDFVISAGHLL